MKGLIITLVSIMAFTFSTSLNAQMAKSSELVAIEKTNDSASEEVAILQDFKANKTQRRVIKKIKKYVTPKMFAKGVRTTALEGKTVTVQLSLDANGAITNMQIVKGFEDSLDAKVMKFIKEYDSKNPLANSKLDRPAIIQVEVPLVGRMQYMN
jgi:hypothetical protein